MGKSTKKEGNTNTTKGIDLLEVYYEASSQVTKQINSLGGKAVRFTQKGGDLGTGEDSHVGTPKCMGSTRMQPMGKLLTI